MKNFQIFLPILSVLSIFTLILVSSDSFLASAQDIWTRLTPTPTPTFSLIPISLNTLAQFEIKTTSGTSDTLTVSCSGDTPFVAGGGPQGTFAMNDGDSYPVAPNQWVCTRKCDNTHCQNVSWSCHAVCTNQSTRIVSANDTTSDTLQVNCPAGTYIYGGGVSGVFSSNDGGEGFPQGNGWSCSRGCSGTWCQGSQWSCYAVCGQAPTTVRKTTGTTDYLSTACPPDTQIVGGGRAPVCDKNDAGGSWPSDNRWNCTKSTGNGQWNCGNIPMNCYALCVPKITPSPTPSPSPSVTPSLTPSPTLTPTPTLTLTPTPSLTPTPGPSPTPGIFACTGLSASPISGGATLNVTFTASGNSTGIEVKGFEFNFGDNQTQFVEKRFTGSSSVSVSHTYIPAGKYIASVRVQDVNNNFSSIPEVCKQTIEVTGVVLAQPPKEVPRSGVELPLLLPLLGSIGWWLLKKRHL